MDVVQTSRASLHYSKPLGIALFQKLGTLIGGDTTFGVRFCSPLLAAIMGFMILRFLTREAGPRLAGLGAHRHARPHRCSASVQC